MAASSFPDLAHRFLKGAFLKIQHTLYRPSQKQEQVKGGYFLSGCELQTSLLCSCLLQIAEITSVTMKLLVSKCLKSHRKVERRLKLYKAGDHISQACNKATSLDPKATLLGNQTCTTPRRPGLGWGWGTDLGSLLNTLWSCF